MSFKNFEAGRVPNWAVEQIADPEDREDSWGRIEMSAYALSLAPDAFRWWLEQELSGLRKTMLSEYFRQLEGE